MKKWIIRDGQIINPGGTGIHIQNPPGDVEISRMFIAAGCCISLGGDPEPQSITLTQLVQALRENLGFLSSARQRHRATEILDEIVTDPSTERARRGLKIVYDMSMSAQAFELSRILEPFVQWFPS